MELFVVWQVRGGMQEQMAGMVEDQAVVSGQPGVFRRRRGEAARTRKVFVRFSEQEFAVISAAAQAAHLSPTSYVGEVAVAVATDTRPPVGSPLQDALGEFMAARTQVSKTRAVLAELGDRGGVVDDAREASQICMRHVEELMAIAGQIQRLVERYR